MPVQILADWRSRRLVHGDVKPSNIVVDSDWHVFLLDLESVVELPTAKTTHRSKAYTVVYAAPEVRKKKVVTLTSDLYSVGVMIAEAVLVGALQACFVMCLGNMGVVVDQVGVVPREMKAKWMAVAKVLQAADPEARTVGLDLVPLSAVTVHRSIPVESLESSDHGNSSSTHLPTD